MASRSATSGTPWAATGLEVLGNADFTNGRLSRSGTTVVCFAAAWCPVTRRFMSRLVALKDTLPATLAIADITDLENPLWEDFRVRITPSIIVFRDGEVLQRVDGMRFLGITRSALSKLALSFSAH
ncbi:MAG: thioredoxin family protein [Thermoplasmata archaeon]